MNLLTLPAQENPRAAIIIANACFTDLSDPLLQTGLISTLRLIVIGGTINRQHLADKTDRLIPLVLHTINQLATLSRSELSFDDILENLLIQTQIKLF